MNFIVNRSEEDQLSKTINFLNFNNYKVLTSGNVSIAIVFIQSHNDLMNEELKKVLYRYINDKTPYLLISQTQSNSNIQLNCLNTFLNLKIELSPYFDDYDMVYDYVKEIDRMYKSMFKNSSNNSRKVKFNIKKSQEKVQNEIEQKVKKIKIMIDNDQIK